MNPRKAAAVKRKSLDFVQFPAAVISATLGKVVGLQRAGDGFMVWGRIRRGFVRCLLVGARTWALVSNMLLAMEDLMSNFTGRFAIT